jgi:hypothetical protein
MPLIVFSAVTCEAKNVIVGFGFIKSEDPESYEWLWKNFVMERSLE